MFPLVTVIIPSRNAGPWIASAIQSGLAQTYSNVEVIVVDDASTDETRDIIRSFDGRLKYHFLSERHGAPHARNTGLEMASGDFVHFLDADDILFPQCVEHKMKACLEKKADVVYSGGFFFNHSVSDGTYQPQAAVPDEPSYVVAHVIDSTIVTTHLLCCKEAVRAAGNYDESLVMGQEHDLLFRLAVRGARFAHVAEPLSLNHTGHNPQSISYVASHNPHHFESLLYRFEQKLVGTLLWQPHVRNALAYRFHLTAVQYLVVEDMKSAHSAFSHAWELNPAYASRLSLPRRMLVPLVGGYPAERLLIWLRRLIQRSGE
jgi:glycosyltransferase involved in cell wall biosynthesis